MGIRRITRVTLPLVGAVVFGGIGGWLLHTSSASAPFLPTPSAIFALSPEREGMLKPGATFEECSNCPEMVVVPAGTFTMGSPVDEPDHDFDEAPQHMIAFARQFAAGRFAVTFDEWDDCVADGGCSGYEPSDYGWGRGHQPVFDVSWYDARAYVAWLSKRTGKPYRLLSEAEREYITRAGATTPFWWGSSISTDQANYDGGYTYGSGVRGVYRARTVPVGSFAPNPWGLYQVHGNVVEWTEDCYNNNYNGAPADGSAWSSGDCSQRVYRGGSWSDAPYELRAAARRWIQANTRFAYTGVRMGERSPMFSFRVARTLLAP